LNARNVDTKSITTKNYAHTSIVCKKHFGLFFSTILK
jgi:hypothetical protein